MSDLVTRDFQPSTMLEKMVSMSNTVERPVVLNSTVTTNAIGQKEFEMVLWINGQRTVRYNAVFDKDRSDPEIIDKMSEMLIKQWLSHGIKSMVSQASAIHQLMGNRQQRQAQRYT